VEGCALMVPEAEAPYIQSMIGPREEELHGREARVGRGVIGVLVD